ncbi:MAG: helix-turn-helix transcriptional regulator [Armatimonadetes bacterium]|jgi:tetratricopeptide (TPR) repeat protein|nr:helix-turn-helix transcriptional regulator [Armatimonadota bacterium]MDI9603037.1 hypothetical protein [Acidobacteriota bacterium]
MDLNTRQGRRAQGQLIQAAAKQAGYTAEQIAEIAECSRALVYQYYSGATLAQTDRLQRIGAAVGKPMSYFFGETSDVVSDVEAPPLPAILATDWARERPPARRAMQRTMEREDIPPPHVDAALSDLSELAQAQMSGPDPDGLLRTAERIVALARLSGRQRDEADAHFRAGNVRLQRREASLAIPHIRRARELYERLEDDAMYLQATQSLGSALAALGEFDEARAEFERVASAGDWMARWRGQVALASLFEQSGELDLALQALAHVLVAYQDVPDAKEAAFITCYARANQVNVYLALGELQQALMAATECEREADVLVLADQRVESLFNAGLALNGLGRTGQAMERLDLARQLAAFAGDDARALMAQAAYAWSEALIGWTADASARALAALRASNRGADDRAHGVCERELARILERAGRTDEALYHAEEGVRVLSDLRMEVPALEARVVCARLTAQAEGVSKPLIAVRDRACAVGAKMAEMEARIGLAQWGPSDARSEEASQALALARGMKHLDGLIRAASIVVDHTSDPNEQSGLLAEAVDCMEQLRSHAPSDKEGVLEDPVRLSLCRRYLAHLREGRGPDPDEWLEKMAWPPIAE